MRFQSYETTPISRNSPRPVRLYSAISLLILAVIPAYNDRYRVYKIVSVYSFDNVTYYSIVYVLVMYNRLTVDYVHHSSVKRYHINVHAKELR